MGDIILRSLDWDAISIIRMWSDDADHEERPLPKAEAHSVILQLKHFERHRLWRGGALIYEGGHAAGACSITDLAEEWRCHHRSAFDNVRLHIPRATLSDFCHRSGLSHFVGFASPAGGSDPVL